MIHSFEHELTFYFILFTKGNNFKTTPFTLHVSLSPNYHRVVLRAPLIYIASHTYYSKYHQHKERVTVLHRIIKGQPEYYHHKWPILTMQILII